MTVKSILSLVTSLLAVSILFSQCQSSKIAYGNKYYFKQTPRTADNDTAFDPRTEAPTQVTSQGFTEEPVITASVQKSVVKQESAQEMILEAKEQLAANLNAGEKARLKQRAEKIQNLAQSAQDEKIDRQERRAFRKEMKKEMKALARDFNSITESKDSNAFDDLDDNLRKAIIFWAIAVGLGIFSAFVPFVYILASISGLIGTIFFILWLVEELD